MSFRFVRFIQPAATTAEHEQEIMSTRPTRGSFKVGKLLLNPFLFERAISCIDPTPCIAIANSLSWSLTEMPTWPKFNERDILTLSRTAESRSKFKLQAEVS